MTTAISMPAGEPATKTDDLLFKPLALGPYTLPNRIVMAPLTRSRSRPPGNVPWELNAEHYRQRASAGLILGEATHVAPEGQGFPAMPGIYSEAQVEGWRKVTDAVHDAGGLVYAQLWHAGRVSHPDVHHRWPVAPSAIRPDTWTYVPGPDGWEQVPVPLPRECLRISSIWASHCAMAVSISAASRLSAPRGKVSSIWRLR